MTNEDLQQFVSVMKDWIPEDASIAIAFNNCYLHYISGIHDIQIKIGQTVEQGSIAEKVITKQSKVEGLMDNPSIGVPYYGIGYPIIVDDKVGVLLIIFPPTYPFLKKQSLTFLTGKDDDTWCPVPIERVAFLESLQKKTWFTSEGQHYQSIYTLKELDYQLPDSFLRIHRSYIVNISYIDEISRSFSSTIQLTLKDGTVLPVSQSYSNQVRKKLGF